MSKSTQIEKAKRVNIAIAIMKGSESLSQAASTLARQEHLSRRQAYRYLREAAHLESAQAIPTQKTAFTVKIPIDLLEALRQNAKDSQCSLSEMTAQALNAFLLRRRGG